MKLLRIAALVWCLNAPLSHALAPEICQSLVPAAPLVYTATCAAAAVGIELVRQNTTEESGVYKMINKKAGITGYAFITASALVTAVTYLYTLNNC